MAVQGFFNKIFNQGGPTGENTVTEVGSLVIGTVFCETFGRSMYSKIMHECADRAMIPKEVKKEGYIVTVHDSYSPAKRGLVHIIVDAMLDCDHVFIRKEKLPNDVYIFHKVNQYDAKSADGRVDSDLIELDFRRFYEAKIVCLLFQLLGGVMQTLSNNVTVSGALLIKIHALSEMIANAQNQKPLLDQLQQLNDGLTQGRPGFIDAKSSLEFPKFDASPAESGASFIFSMISSITGLPSSYIFGEVVGGLGDSSNSDNRRMNSAISRYYHSIYSGVIYAVYDKLFDYKQIVDDVNALVSAFAFIETTQLLNANGKLKFMINNTGLDEEDFNIEANPVAE